MPSGHGTRDKREALLGALMTCPTVRQAAAQAGVSLSTAKRWLGQPQFKQAYVEARRQALGETLAYLQQAMLGAVARLQALLIDATSTPMIQLGAAKALLDYGLRAAELEHVVERLERIETHFLTQKGTL
jgi:hypothetical protein